LSIEPIIPGLWRIPLAGDSVNVYLLKGEDGFTMLDCGYRRSAPTILRLMETAGCSKQDLRRVVISHSDLDHAGALVALRAATNAEILAHQREIDLIEGRCSRQWGKGIRAALVSLAYTVCVRAQRSQKAPALVDRSLVDGELLEGGWTVVHTPGHTPGHISLYHLGEELLLAGDLLGRRQGRIHGPKRWLAADFAEAMASVQKVAQLRPRAICFGHLSPLTHVDPRSLIELADQLERRYRHVGTPRSADRPVMDRAIRADDSPESGEIKRMEDQNPKL
jgi:glyoxylase-like metal-dependent hydrolase (beta-lactamase superfamily II)